MGKDHGGNTKGDNIGERLWGQIRMMHLGYVLLIAFGFAASCLLWGYVFTGLRPLSLKILLVEGVIMLIMLGAYLYRSFFIGYDDRVWRNIWITWAVSSLLSVIGFYFAGISLIGPPTEAAGRGMYVMMRLITNVFASMALAVLPALLISFAIWGLVRVIEFFTGA